MSFLLKAAFIFHLPSAWPVPEQLFRSFRTFAVLGVRHRVTDFITLGNMSLNDKTRAQGGFGQIDNHNGKLSLP
jgi:hypothetical protein